MTILNNFRNWFQHKLLKLPYTLYCGVDQGSGETVLLLHGIASSGHKWRHVVRALTDAPLRVIVPDLLGFGQSPKPLDDWVHYDVSDQARAVIKTLHKRRVHGRVTIVGHSMGCFVAVEIAAIRPDLVKSLILYEPPFYVGLPKTNKYRLRQSAYFSLYKAIIKQPPKGFDKFSMAKRLVAHVTGFELSHETWVPFERSMRNAIMKQTALDDLKRITTPTQILYGRYDQIVFNDKKNLFFSQGAAHVKVSELPAAHVISLKASRVIAKRIMQVTSAV